jgi:F0F1-type ATP synthase membrane subunit b/b'
MDLDKLLELVDQMRLGIPKDIQEAEGVLDKREALINQSLMDARRIKASAEEESRTKLEESEISQSARQQAETILAEAKQRADALLQDAQRKAHLTMQEAQGFGEGRVSEANVYAHETLRDLEQHLSVVLNSVRRGLDSLEQLQTTAKVAS